MTAKTKTDKTLWDLGYETASRLALTGEPFTPSYPVAPAAPLVNAAVDRVVAAGFRVGVHGVPTAEHPLAAQISAGAAAYFRDDPKKVLDVVVNGD